jgi:surfeit locus 1 family protein
MTTTTPTTPASAAEESLSFRSNRSRPVLWVTLLLAGLFTFAGCIALGLWQLNRLSWKTDLITRIDQRLQAAPVPAPGPADWPALNATAAEYRRVTLRGRFVHELETLVSATTALGSGYWVLTPLKTEDGYWVLVNRGFVPPDKRDRAARGERDSDGVRTVAGLLRLTEPTGRTLQRNDPAAGRWYSRDVVAIATARGLGTNTQGERAGLVAPYFVDVAAADDAPLDWPRAGLTVLQFSNNHLMYALTWFVLAAMVAVGLGYVVASENRAQRRRAAAGQAD